MTAREPQTASDEQAEPTAQESLLAMIGFLRALRRRRDTVAWAVTVALVVATAYYIIAPRYYQSTARLQIIYQDADALGSQDDGRSEDLMTTHKEIVRTPVVVGEAIRTLAPEHHTDLEDVAPRDWVEKITENLSAATIRNTNLIRVGYRSRSPEAAAAVVSSVIKSYLKYVAETHRGTAADLYEKNQAQLRDTRAKQASVTGQLLTARRAAGDIKTSQNDGVVDPLITQAVRLNDALVEATRERVQLEASLATVKAAIQAGANLRQHLSLIEEAVGEQLLMSSLGIGQQDLESLGEQKKKLLDTRAELERLSPFYGPNHPSIRSLQQQAGTIEQYLTEYHSLAGRRFDTMNNTELAPMLTSILTRSVEQARHHEGLLARSFQDARAQAAIHSGRLVEIASLERELERLDRQYDELFTKGNSIDQHQVQAPITASIVEEPLPATQPISPRLMLVYTMALAAGLSIGCLGVYLQDLLDDRFNSPEELSQQLGLPVLSIVRRLAPVGGEGLDSVHTFASADASDGEAFRTLRTALTIGADPSDRIAISSAEPSDGKTTVSINLAVSFAQVGKRTLVIDADLRKPGMTALTGLKSQPGVTDLLIATEGLEELAAKCVHKTPQEGLEVIPAGPRRPDAAELLSGNNFVELLAWADTHYDQVLIDCPPVLAVSDAQVIGRLADGVMLVVSPEKNHRRLVARACESFLSAGINMFGVVANQVSQMSDSSYGYGYSYGYGQEEADDQMPTQQAA